MLQEQLHSMHRKYAPVSGLPFVFTADLHLKSLCQICMHKHVARPETGMVPSASQSHPNACYTPMEQHQAPEPAQSGQ